jgi:hypothetical protein
VPGEYLEEGSATDSLNLDLVAETAELNNTEAASCDMMNVGIQHH